MRLELRRDVGSAAIGAPPVPRRGGVVLGQGVGARYDIAADALVEQVLDRPSCAVGAASTLDYHGFCAGTRAGHAGGTFDPGCLWRVCQFRSLFLRSLEGREERHHWKPDGGKAALNIESFLAWLPADVRRELKSCSAGWERQARDALQAAIADVEAVR
jgi:hypothetical protein